MQGRRGKTGSKGGMERSEGRMGNVDSVAKKSYSSFPPSIHHHALPSPSALPPSLHQLKHIKQPAKDRRAEACVEDPRFVLLGVSCQHAAIP